MKRALVTILFGLLVTTTACKKKDDAAKTDDKTAQPADPKAVEQKAGDPAAAPSGELSPGDYEAKNIDLMDKAIATFGSVGTDCDKGAVAVGKYFDDNKAQMEATRAFEKAHPDVQKQVEDKNKDKTKLFMDSVKKVMDTCKDNKAMQEALTKLPN
jgi:hypothetical protein